MDELNFVDIENDYESQLINEFSSFFPFAPNSVIFTKINTEEDV